MDFYLGATGFRMGIMNYTTLISTEELASHLNDANWAIFDCRFQLKDIDAERRAYEESHIPSARYVHLDDDLSGPISPGKTGRHPLPTPEVTAARFGEWGIDTTVQVVAYDDFGGALAAARLWWMLRWLGHDRVAVLDGGWGKWRSEGRPVRGGIEARAARTFEAHPRTEMVVDAEDVLRRMGDPRFRLFDSRTADRYRGRTRPSTRWRGISPARSVRRIRRTSQARERSDLWRS